MGGVGWGGGTGRIGRGGGGNMYVCDTCRSGEHEEGEDDTG